LKKDKKSVLKFSQVITQGQLENDIRELGVEEGDTLNIKASLGSIGRVDGGAEALINALLTVVGEQGTIVTDSFVTCYKLPLSKTDQLKISDNATASYAGALANAMIRHPLAVRSRHPIQKFAAIGRRAEELMGGHSVDDYAYNVLKLLTETGGKNLKIGSDEKVYGVGTTHVAIGNLGHRQKRAKLGINYRDGNGNIQLFKLNWSGAGHGFNKFMPKYQEAGAIIAQGYIGFAPSKITDMKKTYDVEIEVLSLNPAFQLCNDTACVECRLSWSFSDKTLLRFLKDNLENLSLKMLVKALLVRFWFKYLP